MLMMTMHFCSNANSSTICFKIPSMSYDDDYDSDVADDWEQYADDSTVTTKPPKQHHDTKPEEAAATSDYEVSDEVARAAAEMGQRAHETEAAAELFGQGELTRKLHQETIANVEEATSFGFRAAEHFRSFKGDKNYDAALKSFVLSITSNASRSVVENAIAAAKHAKPAANAAAPSKRNQDDDVGF